MKDENSQKRNSLISKVVADKNFINICKKRDKINYEDIFQEAVYELLTIPEERLPEESYFNYWWYRVISNISGPRGSVGRYNANHNFQEITGNNDLEDEGMDPLEYYVSIAELNNCEPVPDEVEEESRLFKLEEFMVNQDEFTNRVILLYNKYNRSMKKVSRITGISYSALRTIKEKIKKIK